MRNLVHNLRSHRQLRHLASLLLLHQVNQVPNLVASLLHSRRYLRPRSHLVSLPDNHRANLLVSLHRLQDSQVVNLLGSQLRSRQHRLQLVSQLQFLPLSQVVRPQANLLCFRIVHLVLSPQSSQHLIQLPCQAANQLQLLQCNRLQGQAHNRRVDLAKCQLGNQRVVHRANQLGSLLHSRQASRRVSPPVNLQINQL